MATTSGCRGRSVDAMRFGQVVKLRIYNIGFWCMLLISNVSSFVNTFNLITFS